MAMWSMNIGRIMAVGKSVANKKSFLTDALGAMKNKQLGRPNNAIAIQTP